MANIEIYTRPGCGYCRHAKRLLKSKGLTFTEYDVYGNPGSLREMRGRTERRSYPQVFIDNVAVGGCEELLMLEQQRLLPDAQ